MVRTQIELRRLMRLKKGDIINVRERTFSRVLKAKVIYNFKNARIIDIKIKRGLFWMLEETISKAYEWDGFTITLKENLI